MTTQQDRIPIDVVIAWVDGDDPGHQRKMLAYMDQHVSRSDDVAGPTRFRSVGEIFYCVASIYRFAPFVRTIYIITDNQDPYLDRFIAHNFPESRIELNIVDHRTVFSGYEEYLPVFNSMSVESVTHRIPGLSENYIYLNDDFFLLRPIAYEDWFQDDNIIAYGQWRYIPLDRLLSFFKPRKNGHKPIGFKDTMIEGARRLGYKWRYFHLDHIPHPIKKSVFAKFFAEHPADFIENLSHRFRNQRQVNPQAPYYLLMFEAGRALLKSPVGTLLYLKPVKRGEQYVNRKIHAFDRTPSIKFCCIGSLDQATDQDRDRLLGWLQRLLGIELESDGKPLYGQ